MIQSSYQRVLLKLSGEILNGQSHHNFDGAALESGWRATPKLFMTPV